MAVPRPTLQLSTRAKVHATAVLTLLFVSLSVFVFSYRFNSRTIEISPQLTPHPFSDSSGNNGHSRVSLERIDSFWRFHYQLRPGFAYPYCALDLMLDSTRRHQIRDFGRFQRIRFQFRHHHRGPSMLRACVMSRWQRGQERIVAPNEAQFQPSEKWEEYVLNLRILRLPSWWIAANGIDMDHQMVRLDDVRSIRFQTPDVWSDSDHGAMDIGKIQLEGQIVPPDHLFLAIQILWMAWGVAFLWSGWMSWRRRALEEARRASQAEEIVPRIKTEFLATMSHEIRTPLHGVIVPAQLLQDSPLDPDQRVQVRTILESGNHLAEILQDSLDYFKIESGRMELETANFSPARAIESVQRIFEPKATEKGLEFQVSVDPGLPDLLVGDSLRLRQILFNLVSNAMKFTSRGQILLEVERLDPPEKPASLARIRFKVKDTGIGMDEASSHKLFQKFTQLDSRMSRKFGGTGLGLVIAQGLVRKMGGLIEVESILDVGSTFRFTLELPLGEPPGNRTSERAAPSRPLSVLVVDDNRVNLRVATSALSRLGCQAVSVESAVEAFGELGKRTFDLILMDCHMPELDGFEASLTIRGWSENSDPFLRKAARVPIVALTADVLPDIRERCLAARMNSVLPKPFTKEQLLVEIQRWSEADQP